MEEQVVNAQAQASISSETLGKFALRSILYVTILLIGGMIADKQKVTLAFLSGITFFIFFGGAVILVLSGQLAVMFLGYQREKTVRDFNMMQYQLYQASPPRLETVKAVEKQLLPEPRPSLPSFIPAVPAVDERLKLSCYNFVLGLFKDGTIDREKVLGEDTKKPGQIQGKKPAPEVVEYLLSLDMIWIDEKTKMPFYNESKYPTQREAQQAIKHGIPGGM